MSATGGQAISTGGAQGGTAGRGGTGGTAQTGGTGGKGEAGGTGGATPPSGCARPGVLFCDDFEGATIGMPPPGPTWTTSFIGAGTVAVDGATPAHSGAKSVHVASAGGYQTFFELKGSPVFPRASGPLYVRVFMRLAAPMTGGHNTYFKAGTGDATSSDHETRVGVMNAMLMINQPAGDRGFLSNQSYYSDGNLPGVVFQPMTWSCVEALFDPPHSTVDFWFEDKEIPDLHVTDWQQDVIGALRFGFEKYAGPDGDFWYDDVAVGTQPIGCD